MNIAVVMAIHIDSPARKAITIASLSRLFRQTIPIRVVLVGDSDKEQQIAEHFGFAKQIGFCHYVHHKNLPLSEKYQAGVDFAKLLNPSALLTTGSDSWLTDNWCEVALAYMTWHGLDTVGKSIFSVLNLDTWEVIERGYQGDRVSEPDGNGRIVTVEGMKRLGWKLYPEGGNLNGIDHASHQMCVDADLKIGIMNDCPNIKVMEIKSTGWGSINSWNALKNATSLEHRQDIPDGRVWLKQFFPGGLEILEDIYGTHGPGGSDDS